MDLSKIDLNTRYMQQHGLSEVIDYGGRNHC